MTKQNTVTLNLTVQEAECLSLLLEQFRTEYHMNVPEIKPCRPFVNKLKAKIDSTLKK